MSSVGNLGDLAKNHLDFTSVREVIGDTEQVMVYGWEHCYYTGVTQAFENSPDSFLKKVFNSSVGFIGAEKERTLEGREIQKLSVYSKQAKDTHRFCKAGVTNLLLENYKRFKEGKEIIPVLFCVDTDENQYVTTKDTVSTKDKNNNKLITNSELRRCYKLCCELESSEHPELREMANIARQMFKFAKVVKNGDKAVLRRVPALWEQTDLSSAMQKRKNITPGWKQELADAESAAASAKDKYELVKQEKDAVEKSSTKSSKLAKRNVKHINELEQDSHDVLQKNYAKLKNLQASVIGTKQHSGAWREQLLKAAKDYDFDEI